MLSSAINRPHYFSDGNSNVCIITTTNSIFPSQTSTARKGDRLSGLNFEHCGILEEEIEQNAKKTYYNLWQTELQKFLHGLSRSYAIWGE